MNVHARKAVHPIVGRRGVATCRLLVLAGSLLLGMQAVARNTVTEDARFVESDRAADTGFGGALALSGNTALVGGVGNVDGQTGSAWIFELEEGNWRQVVKFQSQDIQAMDSFGESVALDGDTAVVGADAEDEACGGEPACNGSGAVYVFVRDQGGPDQWNQVKKLTGSTNGEAHFGAAVALRGDTLVVGAPSDNADGHNAGAIYLFDRNQGGAGNWGLVKRTVGNNRSEGDKFGSVVSLDGDTLVVGAATSGTVYVYERDLGGPDNWGQRKRLTDSTALEFHKARVDGDTIVILSVEFSDAPWHLNFYGRNEGGPNNWGEVQSLAVTDIPQGLGFGRSAESIALNGGSLLVGAYGSRQTAGRAYLFERSVPGGEWAETKELTVSDGQPSDLIGRVVAMDNGLALVGAPRADSSRGEVFSYRLGLAINFGHTGSWYNLATEGQGFSVEVVPATTSGTAGQLVAYWFTFATGAPGGAEAQRWYLAQGPISGDSAALNVYAVTGGVFDDPAPVNTPRQVGTASMSFTSCTEGVLGYALDLDGDDVAETTGEIPLTRITPDVLCGQLSGMAAKSLNFGQDPEAALRAAAPKQEEQIVFGHTGSWYSPATEGQGFSVEVVPATTSGTAGQLVAYWFTFATGAPGGAEAQRWYLAQGPISGDSAALNVYAVTGGVFDDPAPVNTPRQVGTASMSFTSCTEGVLGYALDLDGDDVAETTGEIPLTRITPDVLCGDSGS